MEKKDINNVSNNNGDSEKKPNQEKKAFLSKFFEIVYDNSQKVNSQKTGSKKSQSEMIEENDLNRMTQEQIIDCDFHNLLLIWDTGLFNCPKEKRDLFMNNELYFQDLYNNRKPFHETVLLHEARIEILEKNKNQLFHELTLIKNSNEKLMKMLENQEKEEPALTKRTYNQSTIKNSDTVQSRIEKKDDPETILNREKSYKNKPLNIIKESNIDPFAERWSKNNINNPILEKNDIIKKKSPLELLDLEEKIPNRKESDDRSYHNRGVDIRCKGSDFMGQQRKNSTESNLSKFSNISGRNPNFQSSNNNSFFSDNNNNRNIDRKRENERKNTRLDELVWFNYETKNPITGYKLYINCRVGVNGNIGEVVLMVNQDQLGKLVGMGKIENDKDLDGIEEAEYDMLMDGRMDFWNNRQRGGNRGGNNY